MCLILLGGLHSPDPHVLSKYPLGLIVIDPEGGGFAPPDPPCLSKYVPVYLTYPTFVKGKITLDKKSHILER